MTLQSDVVVLVDRSAIQSVKLVVSSTVQLPGAALWTTRSNPKTERLPCKEGFAGLGWIVGWKKADFLGADVLRRQKAGELTRRLAAFEVRELAVHLHPDRLERAACRVRAFSACGGRNGCLNDIHQLKRGLDGAAGSRGYDECCDARGPPFFAVVSDDPGEVGFGVCCDDLCCG